MIGRTRRDFLQNAAGALTVGCAGSLLLGDHGPGTHKLTQFVSSDVQKFFNAVQKGELENVQKMLANDKNLLKATNEKGQSGFAVALLSGHPEISKLLAQSGYQTDMHEAALAKDWKRLETLVGDQSPKTVKSVNSNHPIGGNLMFAAAAGGAGADIWRVYAVCGDPNQVANGAQGVSPLQVAMRYQDLPVAEMTAATLLSNDTNPNPVSNAESPPLHIAAERGSSELVEMLIRLGADVDAKDEDGLTAHQIAKKNEHKEAAQLLENHKEIARTCRTCRTAYNAMGKPYDAPDISDIPLHKRRDFVGQSHGNLTFVKEALKKEPRFAHSVALTSEICVEACAHTGRKAVVETLLAYGAPYSLPTAVLMEDYTTVKRLLDEDADRIHERGAHDFGLLWYPLIGNCKIEMMQLLIDRGAKVEEQHYLGTTALHWAAIRGPIEVVELLVEHGANVSRIGRKFSAQGETPLQLARKFRNEEAEKFLKAKGASE